MTLTICLIHAIAFLDLLAVGIIVPLVPGHVHSLGGTPICIGLLGSIYAGFQLGSGPLMGSLSDIKDRKTILIITLLMCSMAYTVIGFTTSINIILVLRAVLGLFKQTQMLTRAMVPDYETNEKKQSAIYGRMMAISGIGITLGPVIGGHIFEDYPGNGFKFISGLVGICFVLNAGLVYLLPKPIRRKTRRQSRSNEAKNVLHSISSSFKQSLIELYNIEWYCYWDVFLLKGFVGFAMGVYYSNYSLYLANQYGLSPKYVGYVVSFQGVVGSLSSYFIGFVNSFYTHDNDYSERNFHLFFLMTVSLAGLILSFNVYLYVMWLIPLAMSNAVARLITLEMLLKRSHGDHRGTLIGASNSVRSLSGVVAPMVAGLIGQFFGVPYVIYASLVSTSMGVVVSYCIRHERLKVD